VHEIVKFSNKKNTTLLPKTIYNSLYIVKLA